MIGRSIHVRLWRLLGVHRRGLLLPFALGLAASSLLLVQALATARVFVALFADPPGPIAGWLGLLVVAFAVRPVLAVLRERASTAAMTRVKVDLRTRVLHHLAAAGPVALGRERSGHLQSLLIDGVENLEPYYARYLVQVGIVTVNTGLVVALLAGIDPVVAVTLGICALAVPLLPRAWERVLARRGAEHWAAYAALHAEFVDSIRAMTTLKALGAVGRRRQTLVRATHDLLNRTLHQLRVSLIESGLSAFALVLGPLVALVVALLRVRAGVLEPTDVFVVGLLAFELFRPFRELSACWHAGYLGVFAGQQVLDALDGPVLASPARPAPAPSPGTPGLPVDLCGLEYRYPGAARAALAGVDVHLPAGQTLALVGPSGSGKSTIAAVLARFVLPDRGQAAVGAVPTTDLDADTAVRLVGLVAQNPVLFHGDVRANLCRGLGEVDPARLHEAVEVTGLAQLGDGDPDRALDRPVGERGELLSGGQRQRVAIARMFLRETPVLVLDEATSALDVASEHRLLTALTAARPGQTRIVIAHRLAAVRDVERIVVLADGDVVERGNHEELMARGGVYAEMVARQDAPAGTGVAA